MDGVLAAVATTIGRLTGRVPTEPQMVFDAMHTPSVVKPGAMMYRGSKTQDRVDLADGLRLLQGHGIRTTRMVCEKGCSAADFLDLQQTLSARGVEVLVGVDETFAVVCGSDRDGGTVTLCSPGDGVSEVPLAEFLSRWDLQIITAQLCSEPEARTVTWRKLRPRREAAGSVPVDRSRHLRGRR